MRRIASVNVCKRYRLSAAGIGAYTSLSPPTLPAATTGYHVGGFHLNAGGIPVEPQGPVIQTLAQNFTFIPFTGALPIGLKLSGR